jgi:hypothetical protein
MDAFKKAQQKDIGPGGINCPCCVQYGNKRKAKKRLRKKARRIMKLSIKKLAT